MKPTTTQYDLDIGGINELDRMPEPEKPLSDIRAEQNAALATEIRRRREASGLTWRKVAKHCGVVMESACRWGTGHNTPDKASLTALDELFSAPELAATVKEEQVTTGTIPLLVAG